MIPSGVTVTVEPGSRVAVCDLVVGGALRVLPPASPGALAAEFSPFGVNVTGISGTGLLDLQRGVLTSIDMTVQNGDSVVTGNIFDGGRVVVSSTGAPVVQANEIRSGAAVPLTVRRAHDGVHNIRGNVFPDGDDQRTDIDVTGWEIVCEPLRIR